MSRLLTYIACLAFVLCFACGRTTAVSPSNTAVKVDMLFHADVDFTEVERDHIAIVLDTFRAQTGGLADVKVVYDLDFSGPVSSLEELRASNLITRIDSHHSSVTDERGEWKRILGWTAFNNHLAGVSPVRMAIVGDKTGDVFRAVFMHEMGHALGMGHVNSLHALMYPSIKSDQACLTRADISEFCRVNECGNTKMIPCERF